MRYFREEYTEAWDNAHDPQRATPTAYCPVCGGEIYSDEELYEYDGLCAECYVRRERCGNCKWHDDFSGACFNGESEYRADFTTSAFSCEKWEALDEIGK